MNKKDAAKHKSRYEKYEFILGGLFLVNWVSGILYMMFLAIMFFLRIERIMNLFFSEPFWTLFSLVFMFFPALLSFQLGILCINKVDQVRSDSEYYDIIMDKKKANRMRKEGTA